MHQVSNWQADEALAITRGPPVSLPLWILASRVPRHHAAGDFADVRDCPRLGLRQSWQAQTTVSSLASNTLFESPFFLRFQFETHSELRLVVAKCAI